MVLSTNSCHRDEKLNEPARPVFLSQQKQASLIPWESPFPGGGYLRGYRTEPRGLPVLLFLHGNGLNGGTYLPLFRRLEAHADVIWLDLPGEGESDGEPGFWGWNNWAELAYRAFVQVLPAYGDVPVLRVGHSLGGIMHVLMAARHPRLADATLLLDPVLFPPRLLAWMAAMDTVGLLSRSTMAKRARRRRDHWPDIKAATESLQGRGMFRTWHPESFDAYMASSFEERGGEGVFLRCAPEREAAIFGSYPRRLWSSVAHLQGPVQMFYGETTYPFVHEAAQRLQRRHGHIAVGSVSGSHFFPQERPDETADNILRFLNRVGQNRSGYCV